MTVPDLADDNPRSDEALVAELGPILTAFRARHPAAPTARIEKAYEIASRYHDGQFRKSGEPFITHPLTVAKILAEYGMDADTLAAAILHDTIEDTEFSLGEAREEFGDDVAELIDGVTKLDRVRFSDQRRAKRGHHPEDDDRYGTRRARVVDQACGPTAQRTDDRPTFGGEAAAGLLQRAWSSMPLSLIAWGVQEIKHEIEDRCFAILFPLRNAEIQHLMQQRAPQREAFIDKGRHRSEGSTRRRRNQGRTEWAAQTRLFHISQDDGVCAAFRGDS